MSFYDNHYYHFNKTSLRIIGQWPFQSRLKNYATLIITALFSFSLTALVLWGLIVGITDLSIIMENISPLLVYAACIMKLINCSFNNYKMKELLTKIEETWEIIHIRPENEILQQYAKKSKIITTRYAISIYSGWIVYCITPIIINKLYALLPINETYSVKFLYRLEHIVDVDKYYNLLMLHGFIGVFYMVSISVAIDNMFTLCIYHIGALFKCIKYKMQRIQKSKLVLLDPNISDDDAYNNIINCIKLYKRILKFVDLLSSAYATCFLFLLGAIVICLSFSTAEMVMVDMQLDVIIRLASLCLAHLLHLYYLSFTSQLLIDYSNEFQDVIYSCNWYKFSLRSRYLLIFTLMRTGKPCEMKAGNMFKISMETFGTLIKMTVSYFTMLTSLQ